MPFKDRDMSMLCMLCKACTRNGQVQAWVTGPQPLYLIWGRMSVQHAVYLCQKRDLQAKLTAFISKGHIAARAP